MLALTEQDWTELRNAGFALVAILAFSIIGTWYRNKKAKSSTEAKKNWAGEIPNLSFMLAIMLVIFLSDFVERRGISAEFLWGGLFFIIFGSAYLHYRSLTKIQAQAQKNAVSNPYGNGGIGMNTLSNEEKKVNWKLNGALIVFAALAIGPILYLAFVPHELGIWAAVIGLGIAFSVLALLGFAFVGTWPRPVRILSSTEIDASPQAIWDAIRFRQTTNWWKKIVKRVERLDGEPETYRLHYYNDDTCGECGLPRDPESEGRTNTVEILVSLEPRRLATRAWTKGSGGLYENIMAFEDEVMELEPLENGKTRVTMASIAYKVKIWLAIVLKLGNPGEEELKTLKAHMEGSDSDSIFDVGAARIEAQRHADKFCGCARGTPAAPRIV